MNKGCMFVISAPSGAGKTTIVHPVLQALPAISFSVSHTTRQPRSDEQNGKDYHFVTKEQFKKVRDSDGFLEWAEVHDNCYGTSQRAVADMLNQGIDVILDIDVQGAEQIRGKSDLPATFIFIAPPSLAELQKRLLGRQTETPETLKVRLHNAKKEMQDAQLYDYIIVNDAVEEAIETLKSIVIEKRTAGRRRIDGSPTLLTDF